MTRQTTLDTEKDDDLPPVQYCAGQEILTGPSDDGGGTRAIHENVAVPTISEGTDSDVRHYGDHVLGLAAAPSEVSDYGEDQGDGEQLLSESASGPTPNSCSDYNRLTDTPTLSGTLVWLSVNLSRHNNQTYILRRYG